MAESLITNRWIYGLAYFGVMSVLMLWQILPIQIGPPGYPGPDLMICVTFVWVLRRPHLIPAPLIALVFLVSDMLFMRPPGLWAALVVLGSEFLRSRALTSRELAFAAEWAMTTILLAAMTVANRLILAVLQVEQAGFGLTVLQLVATALAYPVIVLVLRLLFDIRKMSPKELEASGRG